MALSDSCSDLLDDLSNTIAQYACFKYEIEDYVPLINAIYCLAEFVAYQDFPIRQSSDELSKITNRIAIQKLLMAEAKVDDCGGKVATDMLMLLKILKNTHARLAVSLDQVYEEINSERYKNMQDVNSKFFEQMLKLRNA